MWNSLTFLISAGVGRDYRNDFCTKEKGQIALQIQEVFGPIRSRQEGMQPRHPFVVANLPDPPKDESDMVLDTRIVYVPETHLVKVVTGRFYCDHYWGETFQDPSPAVKKNKGSEKGKSKEPKTFPKYSHRPVVPQKPGYIRRAILQDGKLIVPLCHTHPIRAQLEIEVYGRECFERWDKLKLHSSDSIVSCLILCSSTDSVFIATHTGPWSVCMRFLLVSMAMIVIDQLMSSPSP